MISPLSDLTYCFTAQLGWRASPAYSAWLLQGIGSLQAVSPSRFERSDCVTRKRMKKLSTATFR